MIRLLRSAERLYIRNGALKMWKTFAPGNPAHPLHRGFHALESLTEVSLPPGAGFTLDADKDHEVVTYLRGGGFRVHSGLGSGWFQRASSQSGMTTRAPETSPARGTHLFLSSMKVRPEEAGAEGDRRRFSFADRHGRLRLVAAPDAEAGLRLRPDVRLYSAFLDKGCHVVHELRAGRRAWLQMVEGRARLGDQGLETGDGASFEDEAAVSFTTQTASEVLLFELA